MGSSSHPLSDEQAPSAMQLALCGGEVVRVEGLDESVDARPAVVEERLVVAILVEFPLLDRVDELRRRCGLARPPHHESRVRQLRVAYSDRFPDTAPARRPEPIPERSADPERYRDR